MDNEENLIQELLEEKEFKNKKLFTVRDVQTIFGVVNQTVYNWVNSGRLHPTFKTSLNGGGYRVGRRAILNFVQSYPQKKQNRLKPTKTV